MSKQADSHFIHKIDYTMRERMVGIFVLIGSILLIAQLFVSSQILDLFSDKRSYYIDLTNPVGITVDSKVRVSGLEVGWVERVDITDKNTFKIELSVYEKFQALIRQDSRASISKLAVVGDSVIDISPGTIPLSPLEDGAFIETEEGFTMDDIMARIVPVLEQAEEGILRFSEILTALPVTAVPNILADLESTSKNLALLSSDLNAGKGSVGAILTDNQLSNALAQTIADSNSVVNETQIMIQKISSNLAELPTIINGINEMVDNLNTASADLPELLSTTDQLIDESSDVVESASKTWPLSVFSDPEPNTLEPIDALPAN